MEVETEVAARVLCLETEHKVKLSLLQTELKEEIDLLKIENRNLQEKLQYEVHLKEDLEKVSCDSSQQGAHAHFHLWPLGPPVNRWPVPAGGEEVSPQVLEIRPSYNQ